MPVIPVNRVVDPQRLIGKKWWVEEEERRKGSLTQKQHSLPPGVKFALGVSLAPRDELCPLGGNIHRGITSPLGDKIHSWGGNWGSKLFAPRGEVKNVPQMNL
jgi:hypothetical protein